MCATCHEQRDPSFPSALKLGEKCKDCHGRLENADPEWKLEGETAFGIGAISVSGGPVAAREKLEKDLRWMAERRGFTVAGTARGTPAIVELFVTVRRLREDRFVSADETVMEATLVARVIRKETGKRVFMRLAHSRPVYDRDPDAASVRAVRDAFEVVAGHLAEALKTSEKK
ncbi:MAG: hypothetical protein ACYTFG_00695 [Planctomycetota bacterium]|jgi:hypothetical protein